MVSCIIPGEVVRTTTYGVDYTVSSLILVRSQHGMDDAYSKSTICDSLETQTNFATFWSAFPFQGLGDRAKMSFMGHVLHSRVSDAVETRELSRDTRIWLYL